MTTNTAPITALAATESKLANAIDRAAGELDRVATATTAQALDRLHASAEAAKERIAAVKADLAATVNAVLAELLALANGIDCDLCINTEAAEDLAVNGKQPKALPAPETATQPATITTSEAPTVDASEPTSDTTMPAIAATIPDAVAEPAEEHCLQTAANSPVPDAQADAGESEPVQQTRKPSRRQKRS